MRRNASSGGDMTEAFDHQILDPGQARLRMRTDLVVTPHDNATFVIEDPLAGKYFLVGTAEWSFLTRIDGERTIAEAIAQAATDGPQGTALTEREGISVARWLVDQGLARPVDAMPAGRGDDKPRVPKAPFNPFMIRLGAFNPDRMLAVADARFGWLWSKWFLAAWCCLGAAALLKLGGSWTSWNAVPTQILDRDNWLRMGIVWCALKVLHEFGHGLSCKHFGIPVRRAGLLLIFFAPVPYVDVSGSWRIPRRSQRMAISAAGMYLELLVAFGALLLWTPDSLEPFDRLCVDVVLLAGLNTVAFNANPLMRFDGYYIMADAVGIPNLSGESRRYLSNIVRFWFRGLDVSDIAGTPFTRRFIKVYSVASFGWRILTFLGIAVSLIAQWSWWGAAASAGVGWFWFGLSLPKQGERQKPPTRTVQGVRRRRAAFGVVGAAVSLVVARLAAPAPITAPAVVEYAPLSIVRASAAGFVKRVCVREGSDVAEGTLLLELAADDLTSNVKKLEIELEQARLRSRGHLTQDDLAKHQREAATVVSLESQLREYRSQLEGLQVRAPCRARIVSDDVEGLSGRYVEKGEVLLILGAEDRKELLVSATSSDEDSFAEHVGGVVRVTRPYGGPATTGVLDSVEPRIREKLPHSAFGASTGGEIPVKMEARERKDDPEADLPTSVTPRIRATVELDEEAAGKLRAGQRVIVALAGKSDTWGGRMLQRWNDYLTEFAARHAELSPASTN
jgi:putative peptide zinc metalloprotease protein